LEKIQLLGAPLLFIQPREGQGEGPDPGEVQPGFALTVTLAQKLGLTIDALSPHSPHAHSAL
jgi:hypothetical protein